MAAGLAALPAYAFAAGSLAGETIVVDPGHGGIDGGATAFGRVEKNVTLPIGLDLSALLRGAGARVILTRRSDRFVSLADRVAIANAAGGDAFISIHANALSDPSYSGVTTFYGAPAGFVTGVVRAPSLVAASRALARDVEAAAQAHTGEINRGVQSADYYVLSNTHMPTILIETGFITNPSEGQRLVSPAYQESVAAGIADGLAQFAANPSHSVPTASFPSASTDAAAPGTGRYVVRPGDTLSAIAGHFGVALAALRAQNALGNADVIFAGRTLAIPNTAATAPIAATTAGLATPVSAPGGQASQTYTVRYGDTLSAIAVRFGTSEAALRAANALSNSDLIYAGRTLTICGSTTAAAPGTATAQHSMATDGSSTPGGRTYVVQQGDTLSAIARRHGLSVSAIAQANGVQNTDQLFAGQALRLPGSGQAISGADQTQGTTPGGQRYRIRSGDTLSEIAQRLGVSEQTLGIANQLSDLNHVVAGRYLQIPSPS